MPTTLASGISYVDLQFQGAPQIIATAVLQGTGGVALVDPGPTSALPTLRRELASAGISMGDVRTLLLTHIHLDHAGAAGTLVRENPKLRVYVHERGAPHMVDPSKLLASATRLYGDDMERLWGEVSPVPAAALVTLAGGEKVEAGGRSLDVAYTPGHASHHVSYFSGDSGIAFVGDTAGIKRGAAGYVLPPTPPPDIDLELWRDSLARIERWGPGTLFLTHFGPHMQTGAHLTELSDHLDRAVTLAKAALARDESEEAREVWFTEAVRQDLRRAMDERDARAYEAAGRFDLSWRGLVRYLRKKSN
jgi:glyoxylase-like metal-dependent hydrolase (beta-lactamase superfamily II)